ncbi:MAG TPA: 50S ribosomal protein L21 [Cyanobacteria bacterium UBA8530]|nr:50S ribosomal protein L21 [Cyanobacteria bacterium UBA8530]
MYAIIATGGKQYRVEEGRFVDVELLPQAEGEAVEFDQVLMVHDEEKLHVGSPILSGAKVTGMVLKLGKAKKVIIYKMRPKKHYRRKRGHRQPFMRVMIEKISL